MDCVEDDFLQYKLVYLHSLVTWIHFSVFLIHPSPVFQPTLYKFIILDFLGLSPSTFWASNSNLVLTINIYIEIKIYELINFCLFLVLLCHTGLMTTWNIPDDWDSIVNSVFNYLIMCWRLKVFHFKRFYAKDNCNIYIYI